MTVVDLKTEVEKLVIPILAQDHYDLVEIKLSRFRKNYRLQIFVDSDSGVTLDACAHLSDVIGMALDLNDLFDSRYILEISSPGLDRPVHTEKEFRRKIGRDLEIEMVEDGRIRTVRGNLVGVDSRALCLENNKGAMEIELAAVRQGREIV